MCVFVSECEGVCVCEWVSECVCCSLLTLLGCVSECVCVRACVCVCVRACVVLTLLVERDSGHDVRDVKDGVYCNTCRGMLQLYIM